VIVRPSWPVLSRAIVCSNSRCTDSNLLSVFEPVIMLPSGTDRGILFRVDGVIQHIVKNGLGVPNGVEGIRRCSAVW
jgi:hypothetical protein